MNTSSLPTTSSDTTETPSRPTHTITPYLVCRGAADAIAFYQKAFGAQEAMRLPSPDGRVMHACLSIGNSSVMLSDEFEEWCAPSPATLKGSPVTIHLCVDNADTWADRAVKAGAKVLMPVQEMFWGDRYGLLEDPFGHRWSVAHPVRRLTREEIAAAAAQGCAG